MVTFVKVLRARAIGYHDHHTLRAKADSLLI
jgi:hypothetical protein